MCVPTVYAAVHACISLRNTDGSLIGIVTRPSVQTWKISERDRFLSPYFPSSLLSRTSVYRVIYMVRENRDTLRFVWNGNTRGYIETGAIHYR